MRQAGGERGAIVEGKVRPALGKLQRGLESIDFLPKLKDLFFLLWERRVSSDCMATAYLRIPSAMRIKNRGVSGVSPSGMVDILVMRHTGLVYKTTPPLSMNKESFHQERMKLDEALITSEIEKAVRKLFAQDPFCYSTSFRLLRQASDELCRRL